MTMEKNCQQYLELLPWYVNGTLSSTQALQVFQHIENCPHCAQEQQFLSGLQRHLHEQDVAASAPDWSKLQQRIEKPVPFDPPWWKRGLMPAMALAAVVAIVFVRMPSPAGKPEYRLMTSPTTTLHAPRDATLLRVLLADGINRVAATQLFSSIDADVVAGPTPRGVYTLALRKNIPDRDAFIASLRINSQVAFAEWIEKP
jgi:anti-sigma factor RsiW